jgi:hypothetical protein
MPQVRAKFPQLMQEGLKKIYFDSLEYQLKASDYPKVFNEETSDNEYEQELEMAGISALQEKPEDASTAYTEMKQGGSKRYIHLTYSLGIRTSKELYDDDKYGLTGRKGPQLLARSAAFTQEMIAWNVFNQGFTSAVTTVDGNPLFYNQHALLGGAGATQIAPGVAGVISAAGTYPNRPSTDVDFSIAGLQLATNHAARMIDNMGFPIRLKWTYLVTPPELRFLVREILGSAGKPYTADNTVNSILPEDYKNIEVPWLNSPSAWFLVTEKQDHSLRVYHREKPTTDFDDDFDTDAIKQKTRLRMSAGATRWQGTWGTQGP